MRILKANDGTIYMWDAYDAVHEEMSAALGGTGYDKGEAGPGEDSWLNYADIIARDSDGTLSGVTGDPKRWAARDFREAADDYDPNEPRVPGGQHGGGRWTKGGGGGGAYEFVSPNIREGTKLPQAQAGLAGQRHRFITHVGDEVDKALGLTGRTQPVIGMWTDGAENSTLTEYADISWDQLMASAAMKGWLAKQKQVLIFKEGEQDLSHGQDAALMTFRAAGDAGGISDWLGEHGLPYHTLQPTSDGRFLVHVYGADEDTAKAVKAAGEHYGSDIAFRHGRGDFIGTHQDTGSDAEQRADARAVYEGHIARSGLQGAAALWQGLRDRYGRQADETVADSLLAELAAHDAVWREEDHPRGQPDNAGQFVEKGVVAHVRASLTPELLTPMWRKKVGDKPKCASAGHCYAAAEAAFHLLGGSAAGYRAMLLSNKEWPEGLDPGETHWFLRHESGRVIDPTADQFDEAVPYDKGRGIGFLTKKPSNRARTIMRRANKRHAEVYPFQRKKGRAATDWRTLRNEGNHPFEVAVNPTYDDVVKLAKGSESPEVRLLKDPKTGEVIAWNAAKAIHETVAQRLGIELPNNERYRELARVVWLEKGKLKSTQSLGESWLRYAKPSSPLEGPPEGEPELFPEWLHKHDLGYVKAVIEHVMPTLRYPAARISYHDERIGAQIGGEWLDATAMAEPETGKIMVSLPAMNWLSPKQIGGIMAHEVEHQKFGQFLRSAEMLKVMTPALQRQLWLTDGVTEYSASVWAQVYDRKTEPVRGVHETLAEMARLQFEEGNAVIEQAPKEWRMLFEAVEKKYRPPKGTSEVAAKEDKPLAFSNVEYVSDPGQFKDLEVMHNPTIDDLHQIAREAPTKQVRVIRMSNGEVLAWDADKALHQWVYNALKPEGEKFDYPAETFWLDKGRLKTSSTSRPQDWAAADAEWHEEDHPRGQPENRGEFRAKGTAAPSPAEEQPPASTAPTPTAEMPLDKVLQHLGVAEEMLRDAREAGNMEMVPRLRAEAAKYRKRKDELVAAEHDVIRQKEWDEASVEDRNMAFAMWMANKVGISPEEFANKSLQERLDLRAQYQDQFNGESIRVRHRYLKDAGPWIERRKMKREIADADPELMEEAAELYIEDRRKAKPDPDHFTVAMKDAWMEEFDELQDKDPQNGVRIQHGYLVKAKADRAERAAKKEWNEADDNLRVLALNIYTEEKAGHGPESVMDQPKEELQRHEDEFDKLGYVERMPYLEKAKVRAEEERQADLPGSWDDLDGDQQEEARRNFIERNEDDAAEREVENWREMGGPMEEAKLEVERDYDNNVLADLPWFTEALADAREIKAIPYTDEQLWTAISLSYVGDGEGGGRLKVEFDDDKLKEPEGYDPQQATLPGIEPVKPADFLTNEMRDAITDAVERAFQSEAEAKVDGIEPPEYLRENVGEMLDQEWDELPDERKFRWHAGEKRRRAPASPHDVAGTRVAKKGKTEWRWVPFVAERRNPGGLPTGEAYEVEMALNPTMKDVEDIMRHSSRKVMRMLRTGDDTVYAWDATTVTHQEVIEQLGLDVGNDIDNPDDTTVLWGMSGVRYAGRSWFREEDESTAEVEQNRDSLAREQAAANRSQFGAAADEWREEDHPRGQPENAGEFAPKGTHWQSLKVNGREVEVAVNPKVIDLERMAKELGRGLSPEERQQGLIRLSKGKDGKVYAWPARAAVHAQVAKALSLSDAATGYWNPGEDHPWVSEERLRPKAGEELQDDEELTAKIEASKEFIPEHSMDVGYNGGIGYLSPSGQFYSIGESHYRAAEEAGTSQIDLQEAGYHRVIAATGDMLGIENGSGKPLTKAQINWIIEVAAGEKYKMLHLAKGIGNIGAGDTFEPPEGLNEKNVRRWLRERGMRPSADVSPEIRKAFASMHAPEKKAKTLLPLLARRFGYPDKLVKVTKDEHPFTLDGKHWQAAATYNPGTGEVTFYRTDPESYPDMRTVKQVMAHEVMHAKFHAYMASHYVDLSLFKLFENEGKEVSSYAKEWWEAYDHGKADAYDATNETLAEIAAMKTLRRELTVGRNSAAAFQQQIEDWWRTRGVDQKAPWKAMTGKDGKPVVAWHSGARRLSAQGDGIVYFSDSKGHAQKRYDELSEDERGAYRGEFGAAGPWAAHLDMKKPLVVDLKGGDFDHDVVQTYTGQAIAEAKDGVIFENVRGADDKPVTMYAVLDFSRQVSSSDLDETAADELIAALEAA